SATGFRRNSRACPSQGSPPGSSGGRVIGSSRREASPVHPPVPWYRKSGAIVEASHWVSARGHRPVPGLEGHRPITVCRPPEPRAPLAREPRAVPAPPPPPRRSREARESAMELVEVIVIVAGQAGHPV